MSVEDTKNPKDDEDQGCFASSDQSGTAHTTATCAKSGNYLGDPGKFFLQDTLGPGPPGPRPRQAPGPARPPARKSFYCFLDFTFN